MFIPFEKVEKLQKVIGYYFTLERVEEDSWSVKHAYSVYTCTLGIHSHYQE